MPSPIWSTLPTSARSVSTSYSSIRCFRMEVISSGRSFTSVPFDRCPTSAGEPSRSPQTSSTGPLRGRAASPRPRCRQFVAQSVQAAADARVDAARPDLEDDAADQVGIHLPRRLDAATRALLDLADDLGGLLVRERVCGRQLDVENALVGRDE